MKIVAISYLTSVINGSGVDLVHYDLRSMCPEVFFLIARMIKNKVIREYIEAMR